MYKYRVLRPAREDIESITNYITEQLSNPTAAVNFLNEVERKIEKITENPGIYELVNDKRLAEKGYRKALVKNYLIFYTVNDNEKMIYISRVIYGRRDYINLI